MPGLVLPPTPRRAGGRLGSASVDSAPFPSPSPAHPRTPALPPQGHLDGPWPTRASPGQSRQGTGRTWGRPVLLLIWGDSPEPRRRPGKEAPLFLLRLQPLLFPLGRKPRRPWLSQQHRLPWPRTGHPAQHSTAMGIPAHQGCHHPRGHHHCAGDSTVLGSPPSWGHNCSWVTSLLRLPPLWGHYPGDTTILG